MDMRCDILICGAGPVGLGAAALLIARGVAPSGIVLIDAKTLPQTAADPRSIALSHGSRQILQEIGAWPIESNAIRQIHVSRRGHFGRTLIDCGDYGLPALGYVARYGKLVAGLAAALEARAPVILRPARVSALIEEQDAVIARLEDGRQLRADIVVQAEGGLYTEQSAKARSREYDQTAIVAHVQASAPLPQRAFERFTAEGPLALLPQNDGYALVWCVRPDHARSLLALSDADFLARLGNAFGGRVGRFTAVSARNAFPLGLNAEPAPSTRIVAIGNAAQTLHPVAGQGLNLGLRDATSLARLLARQNSPVSLQQFDAQRRADRRATVGLTDLMATVFARAPDGSLMQTLLGAGLGLIDGVPPVKRLLAEQMMFGRR
ncbi:2-octaprenyl-6-methoxyphenyl hydroxylase [Oxalobacteraceae bacterium CAVE-383]|nr:2-octaprenyl-6-methoxyphenyl hydroxylase [Oxalobacteraceae bacterium CAVE-383]